MEGDWCRHGGGAKDMDLSLYSCPDDPKKVWKRQQLGLATGDGAAQGWTQLSPRRASVLGWLMCCGCPVCKDEKKFMTHPYHHPQPAGTQPFARSLGCPCSLSRSGAPRAAAADGTGRGSLRQCSPRCWLVSQQNSLSKSLLIQAGTWCFQTSVTAKTRA